MFFRELPPGSVSISKKELIGEMNWPLSAFLTFHTFFSTFDYKPCSNTTLSLFMIFQMPTTRALSSRSSTPACQQVGVAPARTSADESLSWDPQTSKLQSLRLDIFQYAVRQTHLYTFRSFSWAHLSNTVQKRDFCILMECCRAAAKAAVLP